MRFVALAGLAACGFPRPADVEAPVVGFEFANSGADEQTGRASIPLVLSFAVEAPIVVEIIAIDGTASEADFRLPDGFAIPGGLTRGFFPVDIVSDSLFESGESITLMIVDSTAFVDDTRSTHQVLIAGD